MLRRWAWYSDPHLFKRLVAVVALLVATVAVLRLAARAIDSSDYNGAQSKGAQWLAGHPDRWSEWRRAATGDLQIFIPVYAAFGTVALAWAIPRPGLRSLACGFMVAIAAFDVVETLLFRGTLDRLADHVPATSLTTRTTVTLGMTVGKYLCASVVLASLALVVVRKPSGSA